MKPTTSSEEKVHVQLELTDDQRAQIRESLGIDGKTMEFAIEPLEERVTPIIAILIAGGPTTMSK